MNINKCKTLILTSLILAIMTSNINADVIFQTQIDLRRNRSILSDIDSEEIRDRLEGRASLLAIQAEENMKSKADIRRQMILNAKQYLGKPYVWGANGPNAFDCSGFVNFIYKSVGKPLNCTRCTTYSYPAISQRITREELLPGDILLSPTHVIMYAGNNETIESALSPGGVVMSTVDRALANNPNYDFRRLLK